MTVDEENKADYCTIQTLTTLSNSVTLNLVSQFLSDSKTCTSLRKGSKFIDSD